MDTDRKILRLGAAVILCAVLLHLTGNGWVPDQEKFIQTILFLQTGRMIQPTAPETPTVPPTSPTQGPTEPEETVPLETVPQPVVLTAADVAAVAVHNLAGYTVDVEGLIGQNLTWQLRGEAPTVLILHTHGTESYRNTEGYRESTQYRTEDNAYNMISVGARLAKCLEDGGIHVIHDETPYDLPSYSGSYTQARVAVEQALEEYPTICLVLDLHRDAMTDAAGNQMAYTHEAAAKLMIVAGSDAGGLTYPTWDQNLSLAVKLQAMLEREMPGICRPLSFRTGRYNQDLFPNMLLVEVGAAGNTRQEALLSMEILAKSILQMANGTQYKK